MKSIQKKTKKTLLKPKTGEFSCFEEIIGIGGVFFVFDLDSL